MDPRTILIVSFGVGVALQAMLLMRGDWDWLKLFFCLMFGAFAMLPGRHEHVYLPLEHLLISLSVFACTFAFLFMKDILQVLSGAVVLSYTLVFWFAFFAYFYDGSSNHQILALLLLLPSVASLIAALQKGALGFVTKLLLYSWFLIVIVSLGLMQFPFSQLAIFFKDQQLPWVSPLESLMAGMAFLFLLVNATYVFDLVPLPGKGQSWASRMKQWHKFTDELTQRIDESPKARWGVAVVLGVEGLALLLNSIYHWLAPGLVVNLAIVIPAMVFDAHADPAPRSA
jgi:hypothetical protein